MSHLKVKTFNNFLDTQNVVKDGKKTTTEIEIGDSPLKKEPPDKASIDTGKSTIDTDKVIKMLETRIPDTDLVREMLLSLSSDLPELVARIITPSEASKVYELISAVTFENGPYDREHPEYSLKQEQMLEPNSEKILDSAPIPGCNDYGLEEEKSKRLEF